MMKFESRLPAVLSPVALLFAFLLSFGVFNEAKAKCSTDACLTGWDNCLGWCNTHNKTNRSIGICSVKCGDYWTDGRSIAIGRPNPDPSEPPRKVDPGKFRLKNPPTTVSNPNSPQPPLQIQERRKK
jgi:hypothetical protein